MTLPERVVHRFAAQTFTKVNAPVVDGVRNVVDLLTRLPGLCILDSGEGAPKTVFNVRFTYGLTIAEAAEFMVRLQFGPRIPGSEVTAAPANADSIVLYWSASNADMKLAEAELRKFVEDETLRS
jgi:hypothetical protein